MTTYKTVREAAIAGTREAIRLARRDGWEYGGAVLPYGDGFIVSDIVTSKDKHHVHLGESIPQLINRPFESAAAKREAVPAFFHVHIKEGDSSDQWNDYFSRPDLENIVGNRNLAYLGVTDTGKVFEVNGATRDTFQESITHFVVPELEEDDSIITRLALLFAVHKGKVPFIVKGTEVFAGDR